jgi:chromosome segregation ATPase
MKKVSLLSISFVCFTILACNNSKSDDKKIDPLQAQADSLEKEVVEGHDVAMPKSMKIPKLQKEAQRLIDSIATLPAKAREASAPLKAKLEELVNELNYADNAMNKWMAEINFDSALNNLDQRIKYFTDEKIKVNKVKEAVLNSIAKADSLLKAKL